MEKNAVFVYNCVLKRRYSTTDRKIDLNVFIRIIGPCHAKMCLMPYANNKGADQPA